MPLSPSSRTAASVAATRRASAWTAFRAGEFPMIGGIGASSLRRRAATPSSRRAVRSSARRAAGAAPGSTGLVMKSSAPRFIASTAVSIEPNAVMTMTGSVGSGRARGVQDRQPVGARKPPVRQHEVHACSPRAGARSASEPLAEPSDAPTLAPEHLLEHRPEGLLVFDHQDRSH